MSQDNHDNDRYSGNSRGGKALIIGCVILFALALGIIAVVAFKIHKNDEEKTTFASTEAPATEAPATEAMAPDVPVTEVPITEVPKTEAPTTETPTTEEPVTEAPTTEEVLPDGTKYEIPKACGDLYTLDGQLFNPCCAGHGTGDYYAEMVNTVGSRLPKKVQLYNVLAPTAFGVCLSVDVQEAMIGNNQPELIDYIYSQIDPKLAITVPAYQNITKHNAEYIYFNTDHHWTARGAYYAYQAFCAAKGISPHSLDEYERLEDVGYWGYFYGLAGKPSFLRDNPDAVEAFVPMGTNEMVYTDRNGNQISGKVVRYEHSSYTRFIAGDQPLVVIENPQINDGSAVLLVKESYGNGFAPFLVDHYQYVYVADYRYYEGNLSHMVQEKKIKDVIIMNNLEAIGGKRCDMILSLFP